MPVKIVRLTKGVVEKIPFTESGQMFYKDNKLRGFGLRVGKAVKVYYVEKRVKGKAMRYSIATHPYITTEQARALAIETLGKMAAGINPIEKKKEERAKSVTLDEAFEEFMLVRKNLKEQTRYQYRRIMSFNFSDWKNKMIVSIDREMVLNRHRKIGTGQGESYANLSMRVLSTIFNFAIARYEANGESVIKENPVLYLAKLKAWYPEKRRTNIIKSHSLKAFFDAIKQVKDSALSKNTIVACDYMVFLLLNGLRKEEAAKLKWETVDFEDRTFTIKETKNGQPLVLPMSDYIFDMLKKLYNGRKADYVYYVFPAKLRSRGHFASPEAAQKKVKDLSGLYFTLHDLRRTFITLAESLDISTYAVKKLVNHKMSNDVTAGYIISDVERLRKPMQKIADFILSKGEVRGKGKVVELKPLKKVNS